MARKRKDDEYNQLGSEKPFADLSPGRHNESTVRVIGSGEPVGIYATPADLAEVRRRAAQATGLSNEANRAKLELQARGEVGIDPDDPNAEKLRGIRSMRADNERKAAQTAGLRGKIAAVQTGNTAPNWAGYLQGRGVSDDRIRAARALEGRANAPAQPVNAVGPKMDPAAAKALMDKNEARRAFGLVAKGPDGQDRPAGPSDAQRQDPAYRARVESAREASALDQQRQRELDAIRQQVQNQRYAEALMNRGRGIQERAAASRERKDNRIATSGLGPQDRASVLLERRGQDYQRSAVQQEIAARRAEIEAQRQAEQAERRFEADQNAADRGSAEKVATIRANAPAGNRGAADLREAQRRRDDTLKSFTGAVGRLEERIKSAEESNPFESKLLEGAYNAEPFLRMNPDAKIMSWPEPFSPDTWDMMEEDINATAKEAGMADGTSFVVYDKNYVPFVFTYREE